MTSREPLIPLGMIARFYKGCKGIDNKAMLLILHNLKARHWKYNGRWVIPIAHAKRLASYLAIKSGKDSTDLITEIDQLHGGV